MSDKKLSRRTFLKALAVSGASAVLAACTPATTAAPTNPPAATATTAAAAATATTAPSGGGEGKPISFLCRTDIVSAYAADAAVAEWNKNNKSQITLDKPPQGDVYTKIQSAQAAGDLVWDGYAVLVVPWELADCVKRGIFAPLDDFISASKVPNADKVVPAIIPTIKGSSSYEGKLYGIPGNVGSVALAWYWEPLQKAGVDAKFKSGDPITWADIYDAAKKIKTAAPEYTPFSYASNDLCLHYAMLWGAKDNPIDADGIIDYRSDESLNALEWQRKMVDEGLMPIADTDQFGNWLKKGIAIISCFDVAGTMAQQTFGIDSADTGVNFFADASSIHAGCPFWMNSCGLLSKAKNPQGMVDFYLWWFGPDNDANGKQITQVAAKPCYTYNYDKWVKGQAAYTWEQKGIDLVAKSKGFPVNLVWSIETAKDTAHLQKLLDPATKWTKELAKSEMDALYTEIKDELAKLK